MIPSSVKSTTKSLTQEEDKASEEFRQAILEDLNNRRRELAMTLAQESILVQPGRWLREEVFERLCRVLQRRKEQLVGK